MIHSFFSGLTALAAVAMALGFVAFWVVAWLGVIRWWEFRHPPVQSPVEMFFENERLDLIIQNRREHADR